MAYGIQEPIDLARCLNGMSYTGLMAVVRELVDMNKPEGGVERDVKTYHGMAETLADWADAQVREADEQARIAKINAPQKVA